MNRFWDVAVRPVLEAVGATSVVEIGADRGQHTRRLVAWCRANGARLRVIDPLPGFDPATIADPAAGIAIDTRLSLEALDGADPVDVALVDGDHNYYTVRRELELMLASARDERRAPPVFLCHDVCWPYGRRDLYYDPTTIPSEHRHPSRRAGMVEGHSGLVAAGGLNATLHNAEHEGGPANGVLTAIEDVVAASEEGLTLTILPVLYGLGIVVPRRRLQQHEPLRRWLSRWEDIDGWRSLAELAERERSLNDARLQAINADGRRERPEARAPEGRAPVADVRGRSFRPALPPDVLSTIQRGTLNTTYRGVAFVKNPFDVVTYGVLMDRLAPRSVIEIGTHAGGSARWFADQQAVRAIEPRVVSVDIDGPPALDDPRVLFLRGDALRLADVLDGSLLQSLPRPWLVVDDSAHLFETSIAVLRYFDALLEVGDYIVVEDGTLADFPEPSYLRFEDGPNRAVQRFLNEAGERYAIDASLCDRYGHNVTWAPNAWLRRR